MDNVEQFISSIEKCGIGWMVGCTPRGGETKQEFKERCIAMTLSNPLDYTLLPLLQEASLDDVWGHRENIRTVLDKEATTL